MMKTLPLFAGLVVALFTTHASAEQLTIAAASSLKFAFTELVAEFRTQHPDDQIDIVFGSSGKFFNQVRQNAPYDLFFSADMNYPRQLQQLGAAASEAKAYAVGRIVLWSARLDAEKPTLNDLARDDISRIAIANPKLAPYGMRAVEALQAAGVYRQVEPKLVYGENIAHAAQFAVSGNADIGIIALSLALNPELAAKGGYYLIPDHLHLPLRQGFVLTRQAADKALAKAFADFITSEPARQILQRFGLEPDADR